MKFIKIFLLLSIFFTLSTAKVTQEQLTTSYVYKLSKNIEWNNTKDTFSIHLVSSDYSLNNEFKELAKNLKIDGKQIIITTSKNEKIPKDVEVVYITSKKSHLYKKIFSRTKNYPIILISNNYSDKKLVMINLYKTNKNTINFEINRANILSKGLGIKPDIILLGGTQLDVAYLYRDTRDSLSSKELELQNIHRELNNSKKNLEVQKKKLFLMKGEISVFKKKNSVLKTKIKDKEIVLIKTKKEIRKYTKNVKNLKSTIDTKNTKIKTQEKKLDTLWVEFEKTKKDLATIESSLHLKVKKLKEQEELLKLQIFKVSKKEKYLEELEQKIDKKTQEFEVLKERVSKQNILLIAHEKTIDKQKGFLWITVLFLVVFLVIVLLISYFLREQSKINTLLENTQEELRIAKEKADKASLNKSKFIASMSHELRTPLNAVLGYSQLLQKDKSISKKHQKTFSIIRKSGEHLLGLINDILLISKMESGNIEMYYKSANIHDLIDSMYTMFALKTEQKGIKLESIINENLPKYIVTDIDKLRQILINLLNNAVKFTNEGGIKIYSESIKDELVISVIDTGVGIKEDEKDKLFRQYEQTQSGVDEGSGTGLGLALVQEFIRLFNGKITVLSNEEKGSTFRVAIPYEMPSVIPKIEKLKTIVSVSANKKAYTVLIVDDIVTNLDLLDEILHSVGFLVSTAVNGLEAVESVKKNRPDIILMDLRMPVMDGREATKLILDIDSTIPIIAVTASIVEMETLIQHPAPFIATMPKPFNNNELLAMIGKYTDINYIYEEEDDTDEEQITFNFKNIPDKEKEALLIAVKSQNITVVNRLIESLSDDYSSEKSGMENLVLDFNFMKLEEMLKV